MSRSSADVLDENGHRLVVRNGYHQQRDVVTGAGAVTVTAPRVNDKRVDQDTGERQRFSSKILPVWSRKSPKVAEVLPLLYLHGLSSMDFTPALEQFLGSGSGLSAATVTRLTTQWQEEVRRCDVFRSLPERKESGRPYPRLVVGLHSPGETVWIAQGHRQSDISPRARPRPGLSPLD